MPDREKVIKWLECYRLHPDSSEHCKKKDCPYNNNDPHYGYWCCSNRLLHDAVRLLKEQGEIIDKYHKADTFLAAHGWRWTCDDA